MSEHIQPAPLPHGAAAPEAATEHLRTPGVSHERERFNFRLIVGVGIGLAITAAIIHVAVWGLLVYSQRHIAPPPEGESELAREDAERSLADRLNNVPGPHLEGIERESGLLVLRTERGENRRFFTSVDVHVRIGEEGGERKKARLFELREGQTVSVTYHLPGGAEGGQGVATAVTSPPEKEPANPGRELADADRTLTGTIVRLEPRGVAASREWAEVQMDRYGWVDRDKGVAHVPVSVAMEQVLRSKEFRPGEKKKGGGGIAPPGRSNSGRGRPGEDKR